ncbi:MAG: GAF domain-containing protein [Synechococcaceae cyanobacterium RL_1_2]|nr:GAF domain-containing protein [Synechococcaceae cyanobacterium RL_1_2]
MANHESVALEQELEELRISQAAFEVHTKLSNTLVSMIKRTSGNLLLRTMLRQTLELACQLSKAEESSLFWLNEEGLVTESILARGITIRDERYDVIGKVLGKGLAGWVYRHQTIGLIEDVDQDDRWVKLEHQPYQVGSVLCIPLVRGKSVLALITLMHSKKGFFDSYLAKQMESCGEKMALVLDQMNFYLANFRPEKQASMVESLENTMEKSAAAILPGEKDQNEELTSFKNIGICLLANDGRLVYADANFAQTFDYTLGELFELKSMEKLIAPNHREQFINSLSNCFNQGAIQKKFDARFKGLTKERELLKMELCGRPIKLYGKYLMIGILRVFDGVY